MKTHLAKTLTALAVLATAGTTVLSGIHSAIAAPFNPKDLPPVGAPPRTAGGGTRGCFAPSSAEKSLIPLTPHHLKLADNQTVMPLTVHPHPEFYWYVPETTAQRVEFVLTTENGEEIYHAELAVPETPGIMSVRLPQEEQYALQEGTRYYWVVSLVCDARDRTGDAYADGWIERLNADSELAQKVAQSPTADDYARAGIWQEALADLARQRRNNPEDPAIAQNWLEFLASVELGQYADVEFVSSQPFDRVASESVPQ